MEHTNILSMLDMSKESGLVWVSQMSDAINPSEHLALHEAKKFKADAVYFRRFEEKDKSSIPQIYIYDNEFSNDDLVKTHTALWSSGVVPFFYIVSDTEVKIFNCKKSVSIDNGKLLSKPLEILSFANDIQQALNYKKYSAQLFDNGTFWEEHKNILKVSESPYQKLLEGLLNAKKDLEKKLTISHATIAKLLIIGILVRYLEEKQDDKGVKLLAIQRDFYSQFVACSQFTDILRKGYIVDFLKKLANKFNGNIFQLSESENNELNSANLAYVAAVFDAKIEGKQFVLWELYAFNHLPIELISGIYEAFLTKKEKGVVYTPPYLVNALIDECMPLHKAKVYFANETFKVLDPACGSGIFLVAALKRMVQWKAILHYEAKKEVQYPDSEVIKNIIKNNIFGIDIEEGATLISVFSLCIALCDKLSPMQIWNDLRFDDLSITNIQTKDFFQYYNEIPKESFDLVIGNPPFNVPTGFTNKTYSCHVKKTYNVAPTHAINDDNIALFFLDKTIELCKKGKQLCLILPAGALLYNNNALAYRTHFLKKYQVNKLFDFTHLSDKLFHGTTNVAVCALIATNHQNTNEKLLHIIVERSKVAEERFYFELDHYDFHKVNYTTALENQYVWKANLLGGGRLLRLINNLSSLRSLEDFLIEKRENDGWEFGEGYIVGHDGSVKDEGKLTNISDSTRTFKKAEWITNQRTIITKSFSEYGKYDTIIEYEIYFEGHRTKTQKIFQPPHILIKENLGQERIPMIFSDEYLCFKHRIVGIHAPDTENKELKKIYENFSKNNFLYRAFCVSTSGEAGISKSWYVLTKDDIMNLPYPENLEDLELGYSDTIVRDDVLNYYIKSNIVSKNSPLHKQVTSDELEKYGTVFCNILNPIYEKNNQKWFVGKFEMLDNAIMYCFCYGKPTADLTLENVNFSAKNITHLITNSNNRNINITRVVRHYLHIDGYDVLVFIKPKAVRYWLQSIALRDADETFSDLKRAGF
jgi:N-6 DNA Methylase